MRRAPAGTARAVGISPLRNLKAPYKKNADQTVINQIPPIVADACPPGALGESLGDLIIRRPNSVMNVMAAST